MVVLTVDNLFAFENKNLYYMNRGSCIASGVFVSIVRNRPLGLDSDYDGTLDIIHEPSN